MYLPEWQVWCGVAALLFFARRWWVLRRQVRCLRHCYLDLSDRMGAMVEGDDWATREWEKCARSDRVLWKKAGLRWVDGRDLLYPLTD